MPEQTAAHRHRTNGTIVMDLLAHALWAGAGAGLARRHGKVPKTAVAPIVVLAVLPDLLQYVPGIIGILTGATTPDALLAYARAGPDEQSLLPPTISLFAHHLHCLMHSIVVAAGVTFVAWLLFRQRAVILAGWWSHILIDVFSHSAEYYAVPVFYPFTYRGFDGLAWNTPAFFVINYTLLAAVFLWLWLSRQRNQ